MELARGSSLWAIRKGHLPDLFMQSVAKTEKRELRESLKMVTVHGLPFP